jgi:hypothetical protein
MGMNMAIPSIWSSLGNKRYGIGPCSPRLARHGDHLVAGHFADDQVIFTGRALPLLAHQPAVCLRKTQDIGWQKARGTIHERNHMRFWQSPIRFRGKKVFVGQISRDIG